MNPYLKDVVRGIVIIAAVAVYARRSLPRRVQRFSDSGEEHRPEHVHLATTTVRLEAGRTPAEGAEQ